MENKIPLDLEHPPRRTWASTFISCLNERSYIFYILHLTYIFFITSLRSLVTIGTNEILVLHPDEIVAPCATVQPICEVSFVLEVLPHKPHYYFRFFFIVHLHEVIELLVTHIVFDFHLYRQHGWQLSCACFSAKGDTHSPPLSRIFAWWLQPTLWVHYLGSVVSS